MQVQLPLRHQVGDGIGDFKQQLREMRQTLDIVVQDIWKLKAQIGDMHSVVPSPVSNATHDIGNKKMQIVLDVSVVVGVLVGVLVGVVVAQMMK